MANKPMTPQDIAATQKAFVGRFKTKAVAKKAAPKKVAPKKPVDAEDLKDGGKDEATEKY